VTLDQGLPPPEARREGNRFSLFLTCSPVSTRRGGSFTWDARTQQLEPSADAGLAALLATILDLGRPITNRSPEELHSVLFRA
jgi:hypothetical protein